MRGVVLYLTYWIFRLWYHLVFYLKSNNEYESPSLKNVNRKLKREILRAFWNETGLKLSSSNYVSTDVKIICPASLEIGERSKILSGCILDAREGLKIGKDSYIGFGTTILTRTRGQTLNKDGLAFYSKTNFNSTVIGDNCFVGAKCLLLPGVVLNNNSVIGASSLVPSNRTINGRAAGIPAQNLKNA